MTRPIPTFAVSLILIAGACTSATVAEPTTTIDRATPDVGRIVVLDDSGNIVTMNPDGSERVEITDDGSEVRYFQPVWSPTEPTIAWGQFQASGPSLGMATGEGGDVRNVDLLQFPFYFNWSPDGQRVGLLHNGLEAGIDFEIVDVASLTTSVVDSGSPYYFSWSPDGDAVVVHANETRLEIFDESGNPTPVGTPTANFLSPRWTSAGIFYLGEMGVVLRTAEGEERVLGSPRGFANINPNPEGSLVAIHTLGGPRGITVGLTSLEELPADSVIVVDLATGESVVAADTFSLASFWSPDGEKLLMLLANSSDGDSELALWEDGETTDIGTIRISSALVSEALQYSDQYAQSWQVWSPGSSSVVLPGSIGGEAGIWVIPIDGEPVRISDGTWAAWSHS